jgi:activator of HSP90 ATPase
MNSVRHSINSNWADIMKQNLTNRRQMIASFAAVLGSFAASSRILAQSPPAKPEQPSTGPDATRTSLHQEIDLTGSPQRIYEALLDSKQFAAFSGEAADIGRQEGGAFSMFGGVIVGRNIELVPGQRIVQAWRPTYWAPGVYSIVHFELKARGAQATLVLDHTGFPEGDFASLNYGWGLKYWKPLEKFLAQSLHAPDKSTP